MFLAAPVHAPLSQNYIFIGDIKIHEIFEYLKKKNFERTKNPSLAPPSASFYKPEQPGVLVRMTCFCQLSPKKIEHAKYDVSFILPLKVYFCSRRTYRGTPPNSEIICGQNVSTKVVCGINLSHLHSNWAGLAVLFSK